jgi:hypothetical protein
VVELATFLHVDPIDHHDELAIMVPLAILLTFSSLIVVLSLIHRFSWSLTLVLAKDCTDGLLAGGMACLEVEQLPHHPWLATSELMDECFTGHARDERSNHVRIRDIRMLITLLEKQGMYSRTVSLTFCLQALRSQEFLGCTYVSLQRCA